MQCRMVELRCKEVINICDGCRIGYVGDVEVLLPEGRVIDFFDVLPDYDLQMYKHKKEELFNNIEYEFTNHSFGFSLPLRNSDPSCRTRRYVESGCKSKWESSQYKADKFND